MTSAAARRALPCSLLLAFVGACAGAPPPPAQPCVAAPAPPPPPPPVAPPPPPAACPGPAPAATPAEAPPKPPAPPPPTLTKAQGGPRGARPCEFHESVDSYPRSCSVKVESDGTLTVTAKGTALNPNNGFTFRMGGGPTSFDAVGTLDAFGACKGPFVATVATVLEGKGKTYELRFRDHCKIVIR
ncbi:MAG: hypothetical protein IPF92_14005 [Myxococcales bacterium]|nr:hypothetical protein [Myxococcales bacterium]